MIDQNFADRAAADQQRRQAFRHTAEFRSSPLEQRLHGECRQRRFLRRLPHDGVAANQRQCRVPRPHGNREVERRDHADDTQRMPVLHQAMLGAFGRNRETEQLTRQTDRVIADVDHLLHFALPFGQDLAGLERHETRPGPHAPRAALHQTNARARRASALAPRATLRTPDERVLDAAHSLPEPSTPALTADDVAADRRARDQTTAAHKLSRHTEPREWSRPRLGQLLSTVGHDYSCHESSPPKAASFLKFMSGARRRARSDSRGTH